MNSSLLAIEFLIVLLGLGVLLADLWIPASARRGLAYAAVAMVAGGAFLGFAVRGLVRAEGRRWARQLMLASVLYLCVIFTALILDAA